MHISTAYGCTCISPVDLHRAIRFLAIFPDPAPDTCAWFISRIRDLMKNLLFRCRDVIKTSEFCICTLQPGTRGVSSCTHKQKEPLCFLAQHLSLAVVSLLCQGELSQISREYVCGLEPVCLFPSVSNINTNTYTGISEHGI